MEFHELYEAVKKNIKYHAREVMITTNYYIHEDDAFQEMLIMIFDIWRKKEKVTKYFIQWRLKWLKIRIIRSYHTSNDGHLNPLYHEDIIKEGWYEKVLGTEKQLDHVIGKIEADTIYKELVYSLSEDKPCVKDILDLLIDGNSIRDIAKILEMTRSNVHKIKKFKIKKALAVIIEKT